MMFAVFVAFVALRGWGLYPAQPTTKADSPALQAESAVCRAHGRAARRPLRNMLVIATEVPPLAERTSLRELLAASRGASRQKVVTIVGPTGAPRGLVELAPGGRAWEVSAARPWRPSWSWCPSPRVSPADPSVG